MKMEIDKHCKLQDWFDAPVPAVFQGMDLRNVSQRIAALPLQGCTFLGCHMESAAAAAKCILFPRIPGVPFDAFTPGLYVRFERVLPAGPLDPYVQPLLVRSRPCSLHRSLTDVPFTRVLSGGPQYDADLHG